MQDMLIKYIGLKNSALNGFQKKKHSFADEWGYAVPGMSLNRESHAYDP